MILKWYELSNKPIIENNVSPTEATATPTQIIKTMFNSVHEGFSKPARNENSKTATGVKAFNIWISYKKIIVSFIIY